MSSLPLIDQLSVLADETRLRILAALEHNELTVKELCAALDAPQSTISRHLRVLADQGWVAHRPEGTSRYYRARVDEVGAEERGLWRVAQRALHDHAAARVDRERLDAVLEERRRRSREFFSTEAERWESTRQELFGDRFDLHGLLALIDPELKVADLGCGSGTTSRLLAPHVRAVIAVDHSDVMLAAARQRLRHLDNVEVRQGRLEELPLADGEVEVATLFLVLHHTAEPRRVLREARRVLSPGGRLLVIDLRPHRREELRERLGHVWLGFEEETLAAAAAEAGFDSATFRDLAAGGSVRGGMALFVARFVAGSGAEPSRIEAAALDRSEPTTRAALAGPAESAS